MITLVPYRNSWIDDYRAIAKSILEVYPGDVRLHHIGSTAIPGLAAKDVIDLQMTVASIEDFEEQPLLDIGLHATTIISDHVPDGSPETEVEWKKRLFRFETRPADLHVRESGRQNQRFPLICRDYLRTYPSVTSAYEKIKRGLARKAPHDLDFCYEIKDPVCDLIFAGAEEWAIRVGWTEPVPDI